MNCNALTYTVMVYYTIKHSARSSPIHRCVSKKKMTSYKLTYFNGRGGGEICRLIFSAAGLDFEDERLSGDDWKKRKPG